NDVYRIVAVHARQSLWADDGMKFWRTVSLDDLRTILKQPIMTLPYGVTRPGMLGQIREACKKLKIDVPPGAAARLRDDIWAGIEEKLFGGMEVREYMQEIARVALESGIDVEWTTLSGFPVVNRYRKSKTRRVRLPFLGQVCKIADGYTNEPRAAKT